MTCNGRALTFVVFLLFLGFGKSAKNCIDLLHEANGQLSNGAYTVTNSNGESFRIYCQFYSGCGYAFLSTNTNVDVDMSVLRDITSQVIIRHKRADGLQYTATMEQLPSYSSNPVLVQYNGYDGYQRPVNYMMTSLVYVGFVPISESSNGAIEGWKSNGQEFTYTNCDGNANSYIAFLFNQNNVDYNSYQGGYNARIFPWYDDATLVTTAENLPDEFLSSIFEIHHGGCGGFGTALARPDIKGANVGVKFTITCAILDDISLGSVSQTDGSIGSTVTYTCFNGYSILSGDVTRVCSNTGAWWGTEPVCGVHGNWADWSSWDTCSVSCASGMRSRSRTCTNPAPVNGNLCEGSDKETETCTLSGCPVDGDWTVWSSWSACGVTCSDTPLIRSRKRSCNNPEPQYNGADCNGDTTETKTCDLNPCSIDGYWGAWQDWSGCSANCGTGIRGRYRVCDSPAPAHMGEPCQDEQYVEESCSGSQVSCPVSANNNNMRFPLLNVLFLLGMVLTVYGYYPRYTGMYGAGMPSTGYDVGSWGYGYGGWDFAGFGGGSGDSSMSGGFGGIFKLVIYVMVFVMIINLLGSSLDGLGDGGS